MLRPYQQEAFDAIKRDINELGNSLIVMPTASGKSHVIAAAATLIQPVLILVPSRELLSQNYEKLSLVVPKEEIGIYSASFNQRDIKKFTFATIQSVYKIPGLFSHIKMVIIDESHMVSVRALSSMYTSFLKEITATKVWGFTATPFRLEPSYLRESNGDLIQVTALKLINRMRNKNHTEMFWKRIIYNIPHKNLLEQGYLCPLEYIHEPLMPYAEIPVNKSYSDYNLEVYTDAIVGREAQILSTISEAQKRYSSILVFCSTTEQARHLSSVIKGSAVVTADTPKKERQSIVDDFKNGKIKTVFNMGVLLTGFDFPDLRCIILLRPTRSLPLYAQMLGRLTRTSEGKTHGTVIDFTGTCKSLGKIESFELYRNSRGLWDLKTSKHEGWHNTVLFSRIV